MNYQNQSSFWSSFFGLNFGQNQRFIDKFNTGNNIYSNIWGVKQPIWIDTHNAFKHYLEIPELRTVIDKRASMVSSSKPILCDSNGEIVQSHWIYDLIDNPNPTQSWKDVIYSIAVNDALYSNSFVYAPKRSFNIVNLFVPLPSNKMIVNLSGKKLKQMDSDGLIDNYNFMYSDNDSEKLDFEDVVYLTTPDGLNVVNPNSRLDSLKFPLSNIRASYKKRNVLLENIGAIGILSAQNNDIGGSIPMTPEEKHELQRDWYARSKDELIISESNVNWQPMSYPTKDLMLFEELTADKMAIVDVYGLNNYVFSQEKGATFSNVKEGLKMAYNDTIIPYTKSIYNGISEQLGLEKDGLYLKPDFEHLPIFQHDEKERAEAMDKRASALLKVNEMGVNLTEEEKRVILGL